MKWRLPECWHRFSADDSFQIRSSFSQLISHLSYGLFTVYTVHTGTFVVFRRGIPVCRGRIFSHSMYICLTWGPSHLRLTLGRTLAYTYMYNRNREKCSGQATQLNIWTIWDKDRTSAQPQVDLSLLSLILWNFSLR